MSSNVSLNLTSPRCRVAHSSQYFSKKLINRRFTKVTSNHGVFLSSQHCYDRWQSLQFSLPLVTSLISSRYLQQLVVDWVFKELLTYMCFFSSALGGFGMTITHNKAAVFTARRYELFEVVDSTLTYLHPDSRVHSFLSPLPYQVSRQ